MPSTNSVFGNKLAVLAGDFLLARASVSLARLRSIPVVELLSTGASPESARASSRERCSIAAVLSV